VVVQHSRRLGVEVQPEARHVALHGGHGDGRVLPRACPGAPHIGVISAVDSSTRQMHMPGSTAAGRAASEPCTPGGCAATTARSPGPARSG
jgi:hypothetical protein